ncbi:MAG: DegT/DnrJ/EryC1/StrS family aminotransferase, partial [Bacteroidetes bacterium]|nr:DegT/DnrJ/EryC1/StrS family aminotransferase [Bacteroidota bacterium]
MINVTKTFLPDFDTYSSTLKRAWDKVWLTNNGELVQELEAKLKTYLGVQNFLFTNNGTLPLQMALKALNITEEVITTPFSYVATTNAILWEGCKPVFVDIDATTLCIDATKIEAAITPHTQAILATHVYGIPCDIEAIDAIAKKHGLKVIYDAAHAFGVSYKGKSLLSYGDISTCSFHATKIFHTVEGGCVIANDDAVFKQLYLYRQFGHVYDDYFSVGINGKNSEFHAAMGLCVLPHIEEIIEARKKASEYYHSLLQNVERPLIPGQVQYNYSYYPIIFKSETALLQAVQQLKEQGISGRRYFYPSLNELPFLQKQSCPVSEDISR